MLRELRMCQTKTIFITTKQAAKAMAVSESSIKRWIDDGTIKASRTPGGHRRIAIEELDSFLKETGRMITDFQVFESSSCDLSSKAEILTLFQNKLAEGDIFALRNLLRRMILSGDSFASICDDFIYPSFKSIRKKCSHPSEACTVLHRAIELIKRLLHETALEKTKKIETRIVFADIGYEVDGLPTFLAQYASQDAQVEQLGTGVPIEVLLGTLRQSKPDLLWLSANGPFRKAKVSQYLEDLLTEAKTFLPNLILFGELTPSKAVSAFWPRTFRDFTSYVRGFEARNG